MLPASPDGLIARTPTFGAEDPPACLRQFRAEELPPQGANMFVRDSALAIGKECLGNAVDSIINGDSTLRVTAVRIGDSELLDEASSPLFRILDVHPQEDDLPIFDLTPCLFE